MDHITISKLQTDAVIGVYNWEREIRQTLLLDLELWFDCAQAGNSDGLVHALDYATVADRITSFVRASRFKLIESVAEHCAQILLSEFPTQRVRISVHKPGAIANAADVRITIERSIVPKS